MCVYVSCVCVRVCVCAYDSFLLFCARASVTCVAVDLYVHMRANVCMCMFLHMWEHYLLRFSWLYVNLVCMFICGYVHVYAAEYIYILQNFLFVCQHISIAIQTYVEISVEKPHALQKICEYWLYHKFICIHTYTPASRINMFGKLQYWIQHMYIYIHTHTCVENPHALQQTSLLAKPWKYLLTTLSTETTSTCKYVYVYACVWITKRKESGSWPGPRKLHVHVFMCMCSTQLLMHNLTRVTQHTQTHDVFVCGRPRSRKLYVHVFMCLYNTQLLMHNLTRGTQHTQTHQYSTNIQDYFLCIKSHKGHNKRLSGWAHKYRMNQGWLASAACTLFARAHTRIHRYTGTYDQSH